MTRRLEASAAIVLVLALAGCAPQSAPAPAPAPDTIVTETPAPTPEPQGDPLPTLPLTCADLLTDAEASEILQYDVTLKVDETTIYSAWHIGAYQLGMTSCQWGAENKTDNGWDQTVELDILPNADADWQVGVWQVDDGAVVYPEGSETSEYLCQPVDRYSGCTANVLVDGYWAQAHTYTYGLSEGRTDDSAAASMRTLLDLLATRIAGAGAPREAWVAPAGALRGSFCDDPVETFVSYPASVAMARAGLVYCEGPDDWSVSIQPGGAWAIPHLAGQDFSYELRGAQATTLQGTDGGVWACGAGCEAVYAVNGSAVSLRTGTVMDESAFSAAVAPVLAAVVAAG